MQVSDPREFDLGVANIKLQLLMKTKFEGEKKYRIRRSFFPACAPVMLSRT